jgi:hypothetical protein
MSKEEIVNLRYEENNKLLNLADEIRIVVVRAKDDRLTRSADLWTLRSLNRFLISQPSEVGSGDFPKPDTPQILFRAFQKRCHSPHDRQLGFRSSG